MVEQLLSAAKDRAQGLEHGNSDQNQRRASDYIRLLSLFGQETQL